MASQIPYGVYTHVDIYLSMAVTDPQTPVIGYDFERALAEQEDILYINFRDFTQRMRVAFWYAGFNNAATDRVGALDCFTAFCSAFRNNEVRKQVWPNRDYHPWHNNHLSLELKAFAIPDPKPPTRRIKLK